MTSTYINYRVLGTVERLSELEDRHKEHQNKLETIETHLKGFVEENLAYTKKLLSEATLPVDNLNEHTLNEIKALEHFRNTGCVHAPQLMTAWASSCHPVSIHRSWSEATQDSFL